MKKTKRILLSLAVVMILTAVFCFNANAVSYNGYCGANGNNLTWEVDADTATLYIRGNGDMMDFADERSTPWHDLLDAGFAYVSIGDGITSIGDFAFRSLKADFISIPDNVEDIGRLAFNKNTDVEIGAMSPNFIMDDDGVIYTADGKILVYADRTLTTDSGSYGSYRIADGVETVATSALADHCKAEILYVPESVTNIGKDAFLSERGTRYYIVPFFIVDEENPVYSSDEYGILFNKDKTVLISAPYADMFDFNDTLFDKDYYIIPDSVEEIADYAFWGYDTCGYYMVDTVVIGENVKKIGNYAFYNSVGFETYLYIPSSVTSLGKSFVRIEGVTEAYPDGKTCIYYQGTEDQWYEIFDTSLYGDFFSEYEIKHIYFEHVHNNEVIENCVEKAYKCAVCKAVNKTEPTADGHEWQEYDSWFDNCEEGGKIHFECVKCYAEKTEVVAPTTHSWYESESYLYDCEEGGYVYYECSRCYASYDEYIAPTSHTIAWRENNDATCDKDGTKTSYCTECKCRDFETVTDIGSALGHSYAEEWNVILPATCDDRGVAIKHCERCIDIVSKVLPMTGHDDADGDDVCDKCSSSVKIEKLPEDDFAEDEIPEEKEESNLYSFLTVLLNRVFDFLKSLLKIG